jgi:hypothetical protein
VSARVRDVLSSWTRSTSGSWTSTAPTPSQTDDQRAVGLADVLSRGASIFSPDVEATPALFARSTPVNRFNFFISHSWSASRWDKYAGLLYRTSLVPAIVGMHLASLLACALCVAGVLPPMATFARDHPGDHPGEVPKGAYCLLAGTAAFVAVLLGWGRLAALAEAAGLVARRDCFVDKMCIDQANSDAKARGIDQIGRYLCNSEELLILWSPDYFLRLWCCFEVAIYLRFLQTGDGEPGALKKQSSRNIVVVPLLLAKSGFLLAAICMLGALAFHLTTFLALDSPAYGAFYNVLLFAFALCCLVPMSYFFRIVADQRRELNDQMRAFTFSEARCVSEEDRHLLHHIVSVMYQNDAGGDPAGSLRPRRVGGEPADGIARFEQHVRSRMPTVVNSVLGLPSVVPPKLLALIAGAVWLDALDTIAARAALPAALCGCAHGKALFLAATVTSALATEFGIVPLAATTSLALASMPLDSERVAYDLAVHAMGVLGPAVVLVGGNVLCKQLFQRLPNAHSIAANLLVLGVSLALTTVRRPHCGRLGACVRTSAAQVDVRPPHVISLPSPPTSTAFSSA